jgi:hypothetical protein
VLNTILHNTSAFFRVDSPATYSSDKQQAAHEPHSTRRTFNINLTNYKIKVLIFREAKTFASSAILLCQSSMDKATILVVRIIIMIFSLIISVN